jgi:hypothetical protein
VKVFTTQNVQGLSFDRVMKKVKPVEALQIEEEFQIPTYDGDVLQGESGDYLICDEKDRLFVVRQEDFKKGYRFYREEIDA